MSIRALTTTMAALMLLGVGCAAPKSDPADGVSDSVDAIMTDVSSGDAVATGATSNDATKADVPWGDAIATDSSFEDAAEPSAIVVAVDYAVVQKCEGGGYSLDFKVDIEVENQGDETIDLISLEMATTGGSWMNGKQTLSGHRQRPLLRVRAQPWRPACRVRLSLPPVPPPRRWTAPSHR